MNIFRKIGNHFRGYDKRDKESVRKYLDKKLDEFNELEEDFWSNPVKPVWKKDCLNVMYADLHKLIMLDDSLGNGSVGMGRLSAYFRFEIL